MRWTIIKAKTLFLTYYAHMLEYRAEIFLWALSNSLPLILMGIWIKAGESGQFNLGSLDFARYFFSIFIVRQFTAIWVIWDFEKEVIQGKLSFYLLQPIDPVWHHVARHLTEKITRIPIVLAFIGLFFLLYPQAFWQPSLIQILLFIIAVAMAFMLRFLIQYTFSMLAFWMERASAIEELWFLFYGFLSGLIAPLEVFPPGFREIVELTPFPYMMHFPAALLVGLDVNLVRSSLIMLGWMIVFFIINRWLWKKGLKQYSGMGA